MSGQKSICFPLEEDAQSAIHIPSVLDLQKLGEKLYRCASVERDLVLLPLLLLRFPLSLRFGFPLRISMTENVTFDTENTIIL